MNNLLNFGEHLNFEQEPLSCFEQELFHGLRQPWDSDTDFNKGFFHGDCSSQGHLNFQPLQHAGDCYQNEPVVRSESPMRLEDYLPDLDFTFSDPAKRAGHMLEEVLVADPRAGFNSSDSDLSDPSDLRSESELPHDPQAHKNRPEILTALIRVFEKMEKVDPSDITCPRERACFEAILGLILQEYDPADPTLPDPRTTLHKAKLLHPKRRDQYIKKGLSKLKMLIYSRHKRPKTKKEDAHNTLRLELSFDDPQAFENIFGETTCDGIKGSSIEYILRNHTTFERIFNKEFFRNLRQALNEQTHRDIQVNFMDKIKGYLAGEQEIAEIKASFDPNKRSVKTPFTYLENNTAMIIIVDQFLKQLRELKKKLMAGGEEDQDMEEGPIRLAPMNSHTIESRIKTLNQLREELDNYAQVRRWTLPGCKFKKSEIVSFVR